MKIEDIQCVPVQAPGRTLVPILVRTDQGITGLGEAGLQRRWHAIDGAIQHIKRWLIGEDPCRIEHIWQRMYRGGFYPGDRLIGSVIAGIDIALWDIKGQALGVPVFELLGGRCRDWVQCFTSPTYRSALAQPTSKDAKDCFRAMTTTRESAQAMAALAKESLADGHKYFRIGPDGQDSLFSARSSVRRLIAQLQAVREAVGDQMELMVDCHGRLSPDEAVWFCNEIEPLGLFLVEDPIRSEHMHGYRRIRQQTAVPLAAGEQWANKWEFRQAIEEELIDYARIDICIAGGLTEAKKIAAMAEAHMIKILPHNPLGPVCTAASLHLDLACDNAGPQEVIFPPATMLPDVFECAFKLDGTRLTLPDAPGIGVRFNIEAARAHAAEMTEPPHFHREDGSYTNY
ncbi:MAG TPA: mandelate racemase/muconate lactonizing enzyme family protein [Tepidisphaeraceae bacterium]|nr:mandelate racemase/muconate lactonizing enzyme family protein [Tepidisphaeraceae bacterium]